jgi:tRNA modification GTPase
MRKDEVDRDTIAAIATAPGRGGIGVVRVSGRGVARIAAAVAGALPAPRRAALSVFRDGRGARIDEGIVLYFPAPNSYTGEDVLELQGHGGPTVLQMVLATCLDAGARLAEPGEFTQRAYMEGKLDLAQAEAVADVIDAASREAVRSAQRSLSGEFSAAVHAVVSQVTELRALIEAMLDFPEEEIDAVHRTDAATRLTAIRAQTSHLLARSRQGSLLSAGIHVVIAGAPNVGKSSLLNRLTGEERALVTPQAGTTRDALREPIEIHGVPIVIVDTAGLRESSDEVEQLGIARTRRELEGADVVLAISQAGQNQRNGALADLSVEAARIDVFNKIDLVPGFEAPASRYPTVLVSARTGVGLDSLREAILKAAGWSSSGESVFLARERHLRALNSAITHLDAADHESSRWEFFAEELRLAQLALSQITGEVSADDLLGEIFSRFCIGK